MSISEDKADPDNVLWYWFDTVHRSSKQTTKENNIDAIRRFERFLAAEGGYNFEGSWTDVDLDNVSDGDMIRPRNVDEKIAYKFLSEYLSEDFSGGTQHNTAPKISRAYTWCVDKTVPVEADPIGYVLDDHPGLLDEPNTRTPHMISIEEARRIMNSWGHPLYLTVNMMLAKTVRRIGIIVNLDVRDVNIDHPACDWTVHPELRHWDDYIVFSSDKQKSEQGRTTSNKTETTRKIPIDDELKDTLIYYLTIRRGPLEPNEPLFRGIKKHRASDHTIRDKFQQKAEDMGHFYSSKDDDNINPHYWRHWTTTWFEDRLGENNSITDYLRGDKGQATKATYNQWSKEKEEIFLEHVPKFFTGDRQQ